VHTAINATATITTIVTTEAKGVRVKLSRRVLVDAEIKSNYDEADRQKGVTAISIFKERIYIENWNFHDMLWRILN